MNQKTSEILELCLSSEPPEYRRKVYEIIGASGLDPSDPMFLILALTGQIKVFLEAAPKELRQLLEDWKTQNSASLNQIQQAISLAQESHESQLNAVKQALESVSLKCIAEIKETGIEMAGAIAEANSDTLEQLTHVKASFVELFKQIELLYERTENDRRENRELVKILTEKLQQTSKNLEIANFELKHTILNVKKLQQQLHWSNHKAWFSPLMALMTVGVLGGLIGRWLTLQSFS
ncbi:MAG: DUF6753 family protein [Cyanobacteria bacterium J06633_1]